MRGLLYFEIVIFIRDNIKETLEVYLRKFHVFDARFEFNGTV